MQGHSGSSARVRLRLCSVRLFVQDPLIQPAAEPSKAQVLQERLILVVGKAFSLFPSPFLISH